MYFLKEEETFLHGAHEGEQPLILLTEERRRTAATRQRPQTEWRERWKGGKERVWGESGQAERGGGARTRRGAEPGGAGRGGPLSGRVMALGAGGASSRGVGEREGGGRGVERGQSARAAR